MVAAADARARIVVCGDVLRLLQTACTSFASEALLPTHAPLFASTAKEGWYSDMMIGDRIRESRLSQRLSLSQVAVQAEISAATLSRIETNKQNLDLGLFLVLARVLNTTARDLLGSEGENSEATVEDPLVRRIASLDPNERTQLWRELTESRKQQRSNAPQRRNLSQQVEELLAQVEFLHEEIRAVQERTRRR